MNFSPGHMTIVINLCTHAMDCILEVLRIIEQNIEHNQRTENLRRRTNEQLREQRNDGLNHSANQSRRRRRNQRRRQ